jgi:hypothetical protein
LYWYLNFYIFYCLAPSGNSILNLHISKDPTLIFGHIKNEQGKMKKDNNNLLLGIVIGAAAGFVAGAMLSNGKSDKVGELKSKITNLADDAMQRINALRAMSGRPQDKTGAAE